MNRSHGILIAAGVVVALGGGIVLGRLSKTDAPAAAANAPAQRKPLYYRNPMGLPDTSPVPKKDEMGMDYIPVYAEDEASAAPGTVVLSPEKIQTLGVRTEAVRRQALAAALAPGRRLPRARQPSGRIGGGFAGRHACTNSVRLYWSGKPKRLRPPADSMARLT